MSNPFLQHAQRLEAGFLNRQHLIFVDGKWIEPSGRSAKPSIDRQRRALTTNATGDAEDIDRAVAAADRAFRGDWGRCPHLRVRASCSASPI